MRLFGTFQVVVDGNVVNIGGTRPKGVLALLVLAKTRPLSIDRIIDGIWGEHPPPSAVNTVRVYVKRLRIAFGSVGGVIQTMPGGYSLQLMPDEVDIWRFESVVLGSMKFPTDDQWEARAAALESVLIQYRTPLLGGLFTDAPWLISVEEQLSSLRLDAVEMLAAVQLRLGMHENAASTLERTLRDGPQRESIVLLLMRCLYLANRQVDALNAYLRCRTSLVQNYGVEPGPQLRELYGAILAHSEDLRTRSPDAAAGPVRFLPARNRRFAGRQAVLSEVESLLSENPVVVVRGLGGVGKSSVALEVAHRWSGSVCWLAAQDSAVLSQSAATVLRRFDANWRDRAPDPQLLHDLWDLMAGSDAALVVLDNAESAADIDSILPRHAGMRVLITSRNASWSGLGVSRRLGPFEPAEANHFLLERTQSNDLPVADELSARLGRLPLALVQAASFVDQTGMSLADYTELFRQRSETLMLSYPPVEYGESVGTTWQISLDRLAVQSPDAVQLLNMLAFFSPDGVDLAWLELFGFPGHDCTLQLAESIAALRRYSLVDRDGGSVVRTHRLVQAVVRYRLSAAEFDRLILDVLEILQRDGSTDPSVPANWPRWAVLAPHVMHLNDIISESNHQSSGAIALLRRTGMYLCHRGSYTGAHKLVAQALTMAQSVGALAGVEGEIHSELGWVLDTAGDLHGSYAHHAEALVLLGGNSDGSDVRSAQAKVRLGHALDRLGDWRAAAELYAEALPILRSNELRQETADALVDLGYVHWAGGELDRAAVYFEEAIRQLEQWQERYLAHAYAVAGLGTVRQDQGAFDEARRLLEDSLNEILELCGSDSNHPAIAQATDKLGYITRLTGDPCGSITLHQSAIDALSLNFGPSDARVAVALSNQGLAYLDNGDRARARDVQSRSLDILVGAYGSSHPDALMVATRLRLLDDGTPAQSNNEA